MTLDLPKKLAILDTMCDASITAQLDELARSFDARNFPPQSDEGFDKVNRAVASLSAFQRCCRSSLKDKAGRSFMRAKDDIEEKHVHVLLALTAVSCCSLLCNA